MTELRKQLNNIVEDRQECLVLAKSVGSSEVYEGTTATAEDIKKGKTAYSNGKFIEGVLENYNSEMTTIISGGDSRTLAFKLIKKFPKDLVISGTDARNLCSGLSNLDEFPEGVDTSQIIDMMYMFSGCGSLVIVPFINMASVSTGMAGGRNAEMFSGCYNLSDESLNNILASCITATKLTTEYKNLSYMGLTATQREKCKTLSNYQAFIDAGWTA